MIYINIYLYVERVGHDYMLPKHFFIFFDHDEIESVRVHKAQSSPIIWSDLIEKHNNNNNYNNYIVINENKFVYINI
jgi:hypothetical protein